LTTGTAEAASTIIPLYMNDVLSEMWIVNRFRVAAEINSAFMNLVLYPSPCTLEQRLAYDPCKWPLDLPIIHVTNS
jgi:hypothetical protein